MNRKTYVILIIFVIISSLINLFVSWIDNRHNKKIDEQITSNNKQIQIRSYMSGWTTGYLHGRKEPDTLFYVKDALKIMKTDSIEFVTNHVK